MEAEEVGAMEPELGHEGVDLVIAQDAPELGAGHVGAKLVGVECADAETIHGSVGDIARRRRGRDLPGLDGFEADDESLDEWNP